MAYKIVAIQGERGAFSETAAHSLIGKNIKPVTCDSFESLFDAVETKKADFGVIPIENSLVGSIHRNYDLLLERNLHIIGETQERIVHCLIAPKGVTFSKITKAYSHPVALDQCHNFFKKNKHIAPISYYDTAGSVKMLAESGSTNSAAIAGPYAADIYKMKVVRKSIEDEKNNHTRFLLLGRKPIKTTGKTKTSIVFSMESKPGYLFKALSVFALRDINLSKIESRPVRKKTWQYYFYLDFEGTMKDPNCQRALEHLAEIAHYIKILGTYPLRVNGV